MSSESKPDAELIQRIVQTNLGRTAERIVDRSPGYSGSFVLKNKNFEKCSQRRPWQREQ